MKALIVIDVQQGLFEPEPQPANAAQVIARINTLTAKARQRGVPVVFIQHEATVGQHFRHGSDAWQLHVGLEVLAGDQFVRKTTPDSFLNTDLDALLKHAGVSELVVCGYATEFCIDTTVRRAAGLGYHVTLASDAHTTHDKAHAEAAAIIAHHNATLPSIKSFGVQISAQPSAEVSF
ncbi:cysteine hydrolase family protein [Pseudomonas sp. DTU_2021_1001937_2_SI_NGA_ILE_001]|uniref:cysteine hydrolase family protein n=1 Tax=Pseudomonas sp. DTU_2021_1001937_2_SI_NGA_ILE_001 TaxID=3077589 RepID=UPI0028FC0F83|nr:cysteine hydrolase family protein [Pseudomonas sp. DTU_2021_1001937_2_SI_NGA_ILE_001]WNW10403.1 cysteine hydrolase family protein [Pseudomonas sp. DTU_2021_1001937_2_SI_NGA_ILE_001]